MNALHATTKQNVAKEHHRMRRIGIFSGTFDPVHIGHIDFAAAAVEACKLEKVLLLPERIPREKSVVAPYEDRKAMLELAIRDDQKLEVGPEFDACFTVGQTLPKIVNMYPNAQIVFLLGSDVVKTFAYRWQGLKEFLQTVELCIGLRSSDTMESVIAILHKVDNDYGTKTKYKVVPNANLHIASSKIRSRGLDLQDVHANVALYIKEHKLYS
jgi:nicotinate-nucleotide adenylyltransferase